MLSVGVFRRLAFLTAFFAYLQIALGGVVRVSGSGLGCPDWPLCNGRPYPPANIHSIIEYSHRTVGTITGVLILVTVVAAWIVFRRTRPVVAWLATGSLVAIAAEGGLGGVVVVNELTPWLVLVHLALAMVILGFLLAAAILSLPVSPGVPDRRFPWFALAAVVATYLLVITGSAVVASGADASCRAWPLCGSGLTLDFSGVNALTMVHRGAALAIFFLYLYVYGMAVSRWHEVRWLSLAAIATWTAFFVQVLIGAQAARYDTAAADGAHVALATLLWAFAVATAVLALPRSDRMPSSVLAMEHRTA